MIITIDGPVATGKSTIAKRVAERMGFIYYDTGAMYRCLTYDLMQKKVDVDDKGAIQQALAGFTYHIAVHQGEKHYYINGEDITDRIRQTDVTLRVSQVSAIDIVREALVKLQREVASGINAVFEGRDMGTVVFPHAEAKFFLTGKPEVRAKRRFDELRGKYPDKYINLTLEEVLEDIKRRDNYDSSRSISPLKAAVDAHIIETSDLSLDAVLDQILDIAQTI